MKPPEEGEREGFRARARSLLDRYYSSVPPYRLSRWDKLTALALTAFFFALYIVTCSHSPNIAGDSPELIATSYSLGIAHPPGYPLYTLLGYVFTHIPVGSVAFRLNFTSTLFHSLALLFLFLSLIKMTRNRAASAIATAALGLSYIFWFYSLLAEVFSFNDLFVTLLIFVALLVRERWIEDERKKSLNYLMLLVFLCALSLTNHFTILFVFPALVLIAIYPILHALTRPRYIIYAFLVFAAGLLPYIYLPVRAAQQPFVNFGDPSTPGSFIDMITRSHYGSTRLWYGPSATHRLDMAFDFLKTLGKEIYLPGMVLGAVGIFHAARKRFGDFLPLLTAFILGGILFPVVANVRLRGIFDVSTIERFYLLPTIIFVYFLGMGIACVISWLKDLLARLKIRDDLRRGALWVLVLVIALPFLLPSWTTSADVNLEYDVFGEAYIDNLLASVEEGSLIFVQGDVPIELMEYYETVVEDRKYVINIVYPFLINEWYIRTLSKWYPDLRLPSSREIPEGIRDEELVFLAWLTDYIVDNNPHIPAFYTVVDPPELEGVKRTVPWGIAYRIFPVDHHLDADRYIRAQQEYWSGFDGRGLVSSFYTENRRELEMIGFIAHYPMEAGDLMVEEGRPETAISFYEIAYSITPAYDIVRRIADVYLDMGEASEAYPYVLEIVGGGSIYDPAFYRALLELEEIQIEMAD